MKDKKLFLVWHDPVGQHLAVMVYFINTQTSKQRKVLYSQSCKRIQV